MVPGAVVGNQCSKVRKNKQMHRPIQTEENNNKLLFVKALLRNVTARSFYIVLASLKAVKVSIPFTHIEYIYNVSYDI